ncbi:MAG: Mrp/NBP35 family ATP-binding protein [Candidatus Coatesbacteria bacterium]|nr:Mrp/NBP35 family ATP-binding protein [Candidatus Coatesbacteria bacterium]
MGKDCKTCTDASCPVKNPNQGFSKEEIEDRQLIAKKLCEIENKIIVLSGKGGVGKSTVAVNLAAGLSKRKKNVGILDIDIHGPSIPRLLNLRNINLEVENNMIKPVIAMDGLKAFSPGFLLKDDTEAFIWRGPLKMGAIKQFLRDVDWGCLDYLIIDSPPGTGDEPLSAVQLIRNATGAIIVTTPQAVAMSAVRRSITFCEKVNLPVIGIVENMSSFFCPNCSSESVLFKGNAGKILSEETNIPLLSQIPFEPSVAIDGDAGITVDIDLDSPVSRSFRNLTEYIIQMVEGKE